MPNVRILTIVLAVAVSPTVVHGEAGEVRAVTILHTSDLHGHVLPVDDLRATAYPGSLAQVATMVRGIRTSSTHPVLVLDSGDALQGTPLEEFMHVRWGMPSPTIDAMNRIGYSAMAVGNHEFNFGLANLRRAETQASFPFLSANIIDESTGEPAFPPYDVIEVGDLRIGVLGLTTPNIPGWEQPENYRGLRFEPMDEAARRWVPILRGKIACDVVVVLAHTGFERDPDSGEVRPTTAEDYAWRLTQVPGIDLLLTGHTHRDLPPFELNGVIVSQPRSAARLLTRIDLQLVKDSAGSWTIDSWTGRNLVTADATPDAAIEADLGPAHERLLKTLDGPLTHVTNEVTVAGCRLHDCAALDLIHEVQLSASGADVSLASLLSDQTPDLEPGPVQWRWIYGLYVYPNTLVAVRLTGAQIKDVLEHAARFYDGMSCTPDGRCVVHPDPAIPLYNVDSLEGLSYRIDPTRPEGDRVRDLRRHGHPLEPDRVLTVVCNNYRGAGGGEFPHLGDAEIVWRSSRPVTDLLGDWLAGHDPWQPEVDANWLVAPDLAETPDSTPSP